jgi:hypothetical protein
LASSLAEWAPNGEPREFLRYILTETAYLIEESRNLDASTVAKARRKEAVDHSTRGCAYPNRPVEAVGDPWAFGILKID